MQDVFFFKTPLHWKLCDYTLIVFLTIREMTVTFLDPQSSGPVLPCHWLS